MRPCLGVIMLVSLLVFLMLVGISLGLVGVWFGDLASDGSIGWRLISSFVVIAVGVLICALVLLVTS